MAAVIVCSDFGAPNEVCYSFHCFPICLLRNDGAGCYDLSFLNVVLSQLFLLSSFTFIKRLFSSSLLSAIRVVLLSYMGLLVFLPAI